MALLTAQRMGEEITVEANKMKEETLRNADREVQAKLAETARRVADEELRQSIAAKETAKFIELSQAIMRKHSEFLTKLETARRTIRPEAEPPAPPPPPPPTYEEKVADAAEQIGNAMERLAGIDAPEPEVVPVASYAEAPAPQPVYDDVGEPTKLYTIKGDDDSVSPRPKFDFDDLKFGANFDNKR